MKTKIVLGVMLITLFCHAEVQLALTSGINLSTMRSELTQSESFLPGYSGGISCVFKKAKSSGGIGVDLLYNQYGNKESRSYSTDPFGFSTATGYYITRLDFLSFPVYFNVPLAHSLSHSLQIGFGNNFLLKDTRIQQYSTGPWGCVISEGRYGVYYPSLLFGYRYDMYLKNKLGISLDTRFYIGIHKTKGGYITNYPFGLNCVVGMFKNIQRN
jgi:hypothetical protein